MRLRHLFFFCTKQRIELGCGSSHGLGRTSNVHLELKGKKNTTTTANSHG